MKLRCLLFSVLCLLTSLSLAADGIIRQLAWTVETSAPVARSWSLIYGETVDLEVCYVSHVRTMDLSGSTVTLFCRTNGMAEGYSFQATGAVLSARGWARVRVAVDSLLPPNLTLATYTIQATQAGTTNLLTAFGTFKLSGSGAGNYSAPLPLPMAAALSARIDSITGAVTQASAHIARTDNPHAVTPAQIGAATPTTVTGIVDHAISLIPAPDGMSKLLGTNTLMTMEGAQPTIWLLEPVSNLVITFSADLSTAGGLKPPQTSYSFPFDDGTWQGYFAATIVVLSYSPGAWQNDNGGTYPITLIANGYPEYADHGTATVFYQASYATNFLTRLASTSEIPAFVAGYLAAAAGHAALTNAAQERIDGWWFYERASWTPAFDFDSHVDPDFEPDPHPMYVLKTDNELHTDSFTNLVWKTVWSNGWCWAIAYTNTP